MDSPENRRLKLLIAESSDFCPEAAELLRQVFEVEKGELDREQILRRIADFDLLWVRLRSRIDADVISRGQRLKAIITNTTGLNHIDLDAAKLRQVEIVSLKGATEFLRTIRATAELTLGLTLALIRKIPSAASHVLDGGWDRDLFRGSEIFQRTVGIIGYGRLGSIVADYFDSLGARVQVTSRQLVPGSIANNFPVVTLPELLSSSDVISLHADFEPSNYHMIGESEFSMMKRGAYFINTARGELVDDAALLRALQSEQLAAAALDVLENEHGNRPLAPDLIAFARKSDRLLITPHIGGNTLDSRHRTELFLAKKIVDMRFA